MDPSPIVVLARGSKEELHRHCVDCGLTTGRYCDGDEWSRGPACIASQRIPSETWCDKQRTPLCSRCDWKHGSCHFCHKHHWCMPFPMQSHDEEDEDGAGFADQDVTDAIEDGKLVWLEPTPRTNGERRILRAHFDTANQECGQHRSAVIDFPNSCRRSSRNP